MIVYDHLSYYFKSVKLIKKINKVEFYSNVWNCNFNKLTIKDINPMNLNDLH